MNTSTFSPIDSSTQSTLLALLDRQAAAWNRSDAVAWGGGFSETADFVNIRGQAFSGRASIIEQHARIFAGPFLGSRTKVTVRRLVQVAPDVAVVDSMHEVTSFNTLPAGIAATVDGVLRTCMKYIAVRRGGHWEFVSAQNTAVVPDGVR